MASMFSTKPAAMPTPGPAPVMPTPDNEQIQAAKQKQLQSAMARSGRQSTILTDAKSEKLG